MIKRWSLKAGSEQTANEQNIGENQENTERSKENGVIQNSAYQAFLSAIQSDNQKLSRQYSGDWKDLRLNLNVSDGNRKMLNGIWDYYANKMEDAAKNTAGVKDATVNFMALKMIVEFEEGQDPKAVMQDVLKNCKKVEDDCEIYL